MHKTLILLVLLDTLIISLYMIKIILIKLDKSCQITDNSFNLNGLTNTLQKRKNEMYNAANTVRIFLVLVYLSILGTAFYSFVF